jgi:peptide/nickel transport system ATP-binding protein
VTAPLLQVEHLTVEYPGRGRQRPFRAVDDVGFEIGVGETLGLVGESGSGKTTLGRALLGLVPVTAGRIRFEGREITHARNRERRALSAHMQVVFQNPYGSLNPSQTVGRTLAETLRVHSKAPEPEVRERVAQMLERVGLPADAAQRFPAHFSGGQRQRIAIARALMVSPEFVVCDEPVSALDLSVQAQVLNLLRDLQEELGLSYLFVAHDLAVVRHISQRIAVMYRGQIVEYGDAPTIYASPAHPYTRALHDAAPVPHPALQARRRAARALRPATDNASPADDACPFVNRCVYAIAQCRTERPPLEPTPGGSLVACHRWQELASPQAAEQREVQI